MRARASSTTAVDPGAAWLREPANISAPPKASRWATAVFLVFAAANSLIQIAWFWRYASHEINYDAISYIGIARHIVDGDLRASLHGYWSPLLSWCIASAFPFKHDLLFDARVITILSFLLCLLLVYLLSLEYWCSKTTAAFSVLYFCLARGMVALSVYFIGADFLFTATVLGYFILLLRCLRLPTFANWFKLGVIHGLAFLAKAFAMPWLSFCTVLASALLHRSNYKRAAVCASAALIIPFVVWTAWGATLATKYGRFTSGYQTKWNLLSPEAQKIADMTETSVVTDTSRSVDEYMVVDNMYPSSTLWSTHLDLRPLINQIIKKENKNFPEAIKQILILITPAGPLAIILALRFLKNEGMTEEKIWAWIVISSSIVSIFAYCMLVFDARYILPIVPLLIVLSARYCWPTESPAENHAVRLAPAVLLVASIIFFNCYKTSPFRSIRRDYQTDVYRMAALLKGVPSCNRLIVLGRGPFPEHGVGWEAGMYASYFAHCRMVGFSEKIPRSDETELAVADINYLRPDAILFLGYYHSENGMALLNTLRDNAHYHLREFQQNQDRGQFGALLWK